MSSIGAFFRYLRAASVAQRARKSLRAGRTDEGRKLLVEALTHLGPDEPSGSSGGVWFSERFSALRALSVPAAQAGDIEEALKHIDEGQLSGMQEIPARALLIHW